MLRKIQKNDRFHPYDSNSGSSFSSSNPSDEGGKHRLAKFPIGGYERMSSFTHGEKEGSEMDIRFKTISDIEIKKMLFIFDNDMLIQTVFRMYVTTYLNGEIQFKLPGFKLPDRAARWHSAKYRSIWINVLRLKWALGFCPVAAYPHEKYGVEPTIPPLERCKIRYCQDFYGRRILKVFVSASETALTGGQAWVDETEIMVTHVYWDAGYEPDFDGRIKSRTACIIMDSITEGRNMIELGISNQLRSFPATVLEHNPEKLDHSLVHSPQGYHVNMQEEAKVGDPSLIGAGMHDALYQAQAAMMEHIKSQGGGTGSGLIEVNTHSNPLMTQMQQNTLLLPPQRRYVQATQPTPPDKWIEFRANRAERVLSLFLIPPSMILNGSSTGGGGTTLLSGPSEAFRFFENQVMRLHQECIEEIEEFYNDNTKEGLVLKVIMNKPAGAKFTFKEAEKEAFVTVSIPGIPTEDALLRWYHNGLTEFKATCEQLALRTGMPSKLFLPSPAISVKELNGIKPEAPKSSSSK